MTEDIGRLRRALVAVAVCQPRITRPAMGAPGFRPTRALHLATKWATSRCIDSGAWARSLAAQPCRQVRSDGKRVLDHSWLSPRARYLAKPTRALNSLAHCRLINRSGSKGECARVGVDANARHRGGRNRVAAADTSASRYRGIELEPACLEPCNRDTSRPLGVWITNQDWSFRQERPRGQDRQDEGRPPSHLASSQRKHAAGSGQRRGGGRGCTRTSRTIRQRFP